MTITRGPDGLPVAFTDLPEEKFPVEMYAYSPDGELVYHRRIEPYVMVDIPGSGAGSVRYIVSIFGDGTSTLYDDPTCGGTV